jgi:C-methyltransferase
MTEQQPHELLWALSSAFVASRCLHVVAELGVADEVAEEPVTAELLASRCGANADALDRALRLLASHGGFERDGSGFRHTPASQLLRIDHPRSMHAFSRMFGLPVFSASFARLEHSIRTGFPAVETVDPRGCGPTKGRSSGRQ